jgi:protein SCO1/2
MKRQWGDSECGLGTGPGASAAVPLEVRRPRLSITDCRRSTLEFEAGFQTKNERRLRRSPTLTTVGDKAARRTLPVRVVCLFILLLTAQYTLNSVYSQSFPQPSSPLYGGRTETQRTPSGLPKALREVGIDQHLDGQLPLDLTFRDERNQTVKLGQFFGKRPVVISLVYYNCPMLCTQVLNGMATTFRVMAFTPGTEYDVVTVSFDPRETAELAAAKRNIYVNSLPEAKRASAMNGWHFLTGDEANIKRLADAVGFRYYWDESTNQFAHASGIILATPQGKLSQYYYGIEYSARDLRLGLIEASANKIGSRVDQLLLFCYHYDPATGKYGIVMKTMRIAGALTVIAIIGLLFLLHRVTAAKTRWGTQGAV